MTDETMSPARLLRMSLLHSRWGYVVEITDLEIARQAVELQRSLGESVAELLSDETWHQCVGVLSLTFDGADLDREYRLFACWCAELALEKLTHVPPTLRGVIATAREHAYGRVDDAERALAFNAAWGVAGPALRSCGRDDTRVHRYMTVAHAAEESAMRSAVYGCSAARDIVRPSELSAMLVRAATGTLYL